MILGAIFLIKEEYDVIGAIQRSYGYKMELVTIRHRTDYTIMGRWIAYGVVALFLFGCGVAVGRYKLPPFAVLRSLHATLSQQQPEFDPRKYRDPYYLSRRAMFQILPGRADVIMLGDSLTEQGLWQ